MIRTIIVDDEQHCIDSLLKLSGLFQNTIDIVGTYSNVEEAVVATKALKPDLVFLDVEINDKTGFDYLEAVKHLAFKVIFTTAHDKYAVKAFRFSALDFLLKPIDEDDFNEAIGRVVAEASSAEALDRKIDALMHNISAKDSEKRITINSNENLDIIQVSDILYCESWVNYTKIQTVNEGKITSTKTLKYYDKLLTDSDFFRIDQSFLVNLKYVKKYTKGKPAYAVLTDGTKLKVSLSNKEGFFKRLNNLYG